MVAQRTRKIDRRTCANCSQIIGPAKFTSRALTVCSLASHITQLNSKAAHSWHTWPLHTLGFMGESGKRRLTGFSGTSRRGDDISQPGLWAIQSDLSPERPKGLIKSSTAL